MLEDTVEARLRCSSISLEDGADEAWLDGEPMECSERGMSFPSRWQFDPGTTLAMTLEISGTGQRVRVEGVVVQCEPQRDRLWTVTLLFLECPVSMGKITAAGPALALRADS